MVGKGSLSQVSGGTAKRFALLLGMAMVAFVLASCKKQEQPAPQSPPPAPVTEAPAKVEPAKPGQQAKPDLPPLFRDIERRTFQFFWDTTDELNGLTPDRYPSRPFASIAAVGFALTAYPIGIENGWVSRTQAVDRTLTTLQFFRDAPMGPQREGKAGYKGFYYHFLDIQDGTRWGSWVELSSVDTTLLMMGVLFAQSYYTGDDPREKQIREIAEQLYRRVDWKWMQNHPPLVSMGWLPESGFIRKDWSGYNEGMMLYVLALGSPTHPLSVDAWEVWTRSYGESWGVFRGQEYLAFGPMLGHQYSHVWIDFRDIQDDWMRERGLDYFLNSRRAALAHREYAIANPMKWKDYGENVWGLTASDGPQYTLQEYRGEQREFRHYSARGVGLTDAFDDGTIAPTAAIASLPFAPEIVIPATMEMHERYGEFLYSSYGFLDAFNPSFEYDIPIKRGRIVPGHGWVATDYIGIDQGPILAMIANYRNDFVWNVMKRNPHIRRGLERAGFTGGWLSPDEDAGKPSAGDEKAAEAREIGVAESRALNAELEPAREEQPSMQPK